MILAAAAMALSGLAADAGRPQLSVHQFDGNPYLSGVSRNGRYVIYEGWRPDNTLYDNYGVLIDLQTGESTDLRGGQDPMSCGAWDVTDRGMVVGSWSLNDARSSNPAVWTAEEGWKVLPYPEGDWEGGMVHAVTPDGHYCVGKVYRQAMMWEEAVMWDLSGGQPAIVPVPDAPYKNTQGRDEKQSRFTGISADGKWLIGTVSVSYEGGWSFLHNRETGESMSANALYDGNSFTRKYDDKTLWGLKFSADRGHVFGWWNGSGGEGIYRQDLATGQYEFIPGDPLSEGAISAMDGNGTPYASTPGGQPVRNWYVLSGGHWVGFAEILSQLYGTSVSAETGYDYDDTGTVMGISEDGTVLGSMIYANDGSSYVLRVAEPLGKIASRVDLLASCAVSPAAGSRLSSLRDFTLNFERPIEVKEDAVAYLQDSDGQPVAESLKCRRHLTMETRLEVSFRKTALEEGKTYRLVIPEGSVHVAGDAECANRELAWEYTGRAPLPVTVTAQYPADGSTISRFNMSTNPVVLDFDTNVATGENPSGSVSMLTESGDRLHLSDLGFVTGAHQAMVYPLFSQDFYEGCTYRVEIAEGAFTDVQGENPSEPILLTYHGNFVPEVSTADKVLFSNNFDDGSWGSAFLFYEGDHNQPSTEMLSWNFEDGDNFPWWWVRDSDESPDYALASHSMYTPAGRSDDWLVIPRLYLPDDQCSLHFKSQSYRKAKTDRLKVLVWPTGLQVSSLSDEVMAMMRKEAVVVYDEQQSPGTYEETLAGDWRQNYLSLADYAGKHVYIAFLNDNDNQSAVFLDDVEVVRNMDIVVSLEHSRTVVAQRSVAVKGRLSIEKEDVAIPELELRLTDSEGTEVDRLTLDGPLATGDVREFSFSTPFPLSLGKSHQLRVEAQGEGIEGSGIGTVDNLAFATERYMVLEEGTGQDCPACPLGIIMTGRLREAYGDKILPLAIHTYTGDALGAGLMSYDQFLGFSAYPSAVIDRGGSPRMPMTTSGAKLVMSDPAKPLWWDVVAERMQELPRAQVSLERTGAEPWAPVYDGGTIYVPVEVTYALDGTNVNDYLFMVVTEDEVAGHQRNGYSASSDPLLGDWGQGGLYGYETVYYYEFEDVVRGVWGQTFNGTGGLIPTEVKAGQPVRATISMPVPGNVGDISHAKVTVMLIDGNSGKVVNARRSALDEGAGVADLEATGLQISVREGRLTATGAGKVTLEAYTLSGLPAVRASGEGMAEAQIPGCEAIVVKAWDSKEMKTVKLILSK